VRTLQRWKAQQGREHESDDANHAVHRVRRTALAEDTARPHIGDSRSSVPTAEVLLRPKSEKFLPTIAA